MSGSDVLLTGLSARSLAQAIFKAEVPEQFIRRVPAQSLYLAVKQIGVLSSGDLIQISSIEQCRLLLDFDCWKTDRFHEENFWEWLSLADDEDGLILLQKIVRVVDLKLVALLIARYVRVIRNEEPADTPPGPGFYTPDRGHTWIFINLEDSHKYFLMGRLLAMVFETEVDLFYQLLVTAEMNTQSVLEDESYQDRNRRVSAEGIPDREQAYLMNTPLSEQELLSELGKNKKQEITYQLPGISPLAYGTNLLQPLSSMLEQIKHKEEFESEFTFILNATLVHFGVDVCEYDEVMFLAGQVRGVINIGLESSMQVSKLSLMEVYDALGLQGLYKGGLAKLFDIRKLTLSIPSGLIGGLALDGATNQILLGLQKRFPCVPSFFDSGMILEGVLSEEGKKALEGGFRPIEKKRELETLTQFIQNLIFSSPS